MTEKEALEILTGNREDYNSYARALHIAIKVLRAYVADIYEKLNAAGIKTRRVFWNKQEKENEL